MAGKIIITREQYLDSIRQLSAGAKDLAARYDMNQLTWQPAAGERWSILECLDHITVSAGLTLGAMDRVISDARPAGTRGAAFSSGGAFSAWFTHSLEPPPSRKVHAPRKFHPRPTLNPDGILPQFQRMLDRISALVASSSDKDLNSVRYPNPLLPVLRFTVASGLLMFAAHARRHLWQAEQVTREPDFPQSRS